MVEVLKQNFDSTIAQPQQFQNSILCALWKKWWVYGNLWITKTLMQFLYKAGYPNASCFSSAASSSFFTFLVLQFDLHKLKIRVSAGLLPKLFLQPKK